MSLLFDSLYRDFLLIILLVRKALNRDYLKRNLIVDFYSYYYIK